MKSKKPENNFTTAEEINFENAIKTFLRVKKGNVYFNGSYYLVLTKNTLK